MKVGWLDVHRTVNRMQLYLERIHSVDRLYNHTIVGVARGGLIPAVMISNMFEELPFQIVQVQRYHGERFPWNAFRMMVEDAVESLNSGPYIFIDDICDEGITFKALDEVAGHDDNLYCCLVWRDTAESVFKPNFAGMSVQSKEWVVFPWEKV